MTRYETNFRIKMKNHILIGIISLIFQVASLGLIAYTAATSDWDWDSWDDHGGSITGGIAIGAISGGYTHINEVWAPITTAVMAIPGTAFWIWGIVNAVKLNKMTGSNRVHLVICAVFNPLVPFLLLITALNLRSSFRPEELGEQVEAKHELSPSKDVPLDNDERKLTLDVALKQGIITKTEYNAKLKKLKETLKKEIDKNNKR